MFFFAYTWSELRRRRGRTLLTAIGLGVGVGLVVAVNALSAGLDEAQDEVLEPLTGVGADMTVTRPEARSERPRERRSRVDVDDLGEPGDKFTRTDFVSGAQLSFKAAKVAEIVALDGVADAAGSLSVNALTVTGTVPERAEQGAQMGPPPAGGGGGDQAPIDVTAMSVSGIDLAKPSLATMTPSQVAKGRYLKAGDEVVVNEAYAKQHSIAIGDTLKLKGKAFAVVGLSQAPLGGSASDVYMELGRLQRLSDRKGRVNQVQVRADDADSVAAVQKAIEKTLPGASVTTAADLAERIGGSLVDAKKLSSKLGTALTIVALVASFLIAVLLTLGSVAKRVRELGTLKAIGWPQRLVVRQVTGESVLQGLLGGLLGAGAGAGRRGGDRGDRHHAGGQRPRARAVGGRSRPGRRRGDGVRPGPGDARHHRRRARRTRRPCDCCWWRSGWRWPAG